MTGGQRSPTHFRVFSAFMYCTHMAYSEIWLGLGKGGGEKNGKILWTSCGDVIVTTSLKLHHSWFFWSSISS